MAAFGGELEGIAHQVVEHLQQQIPVAKGPRQVGIGVEVQAHPLVIGIEAIGAQGLLDRRRQLDRFKGPNPFALQPGEVEHVVDEPGEPIGFIIGDAQKFLFLLLRQLVAEIVERLHIALDVEQGRAQLMGHVADEPALGRIELHLSGEVLDGHGDALEAFPTGIPHRLQDNPQRARGFAKPAAHIRRILGTVHQAFKGRLQLEGEGFG